MVYLPLLGYSMVDTWRTAIYQKAHNNQATSDSPAQHIITYLSPHSTRQGFAPSLKIVEGTAVNVKALVST